MKRVANTTEGNARHIEVAEPVGSNRRLQVAEGRTESALQHTSQSSACFRVNVERESTWWAIRNVGVYPRDGWSTDLNSRNL
jgi:hypothetical protein